MKRTSTKGFIVGQRAVIVRSPRAERIGVIGVVASALVRAKWEEETDEAPWRQMHRLILPTDERVAYPPDHLEPYRDDGAQRGRWTKELRRLCNSGKVTT